MTDNTFKKEYSNGIRVKRYHMQKKRRESLALKGLCRVCGKEKARPNKSTCTNCIANQILYGKQKRLELKRNKICVRCGVEKASIGQCCTDCVNERRQKQKENYSNYFKNKICMSCKNHNDNGLPKCSKCMNEVKNKIKEKREIKKANGICCECDNYTQNNKSRCEYHAKLHSKRAAIYRSKNNLNKNVNNNQLGS